MHSMFAPAMAAALVAVSVTPAVAQVDDRPIVGPTAPSVPPEVRTGPLPAVLTLTQALEEAEVRSPALAAARADVDAARGRLRQARFRFNPDLNVEVENFAGTGPYSGFNGTETTVSVNQRLDLGGRRKARMTLAEVELVAQEYRFAIARAELAQQVRNLFAFGIAARDNLTLERDRLSGTMKSAHASCLASPAHLLTRGRSLRCGACEPMPPFAQATAALRAAEADEAAARRSLRRSASCPGDRRDVS